MDTTKVGAEKIATTMLAQYGIKFIWDTHVAAAAAYGSPLLRHTAWGTPLLPQT